MLGFEEFLTKVEAPRYEKITKTPELFEKFLPFAMALGVEQNWVRAFESMYTQSPTWHTGTDPTGFHPRPFVSSLGQMSNRAETVMASTPRSAGESGFSSGGGGGGFPVADSRAAVGEVFSMAARPEPVMVYPPQTRVGWIGTGVMGAPMCQHVQSARYSITLYTRTRAKANPILAKGAAWADSPRAVTEQTDIVFTMVGFPHDVRQTYFGEQGVLAGIRPGMVVVDMTTTEPVLAKDIAAAAHAKGAYAIDAPVSGGDVGARNATLSIMVGGEKQAIQAVMPLFEILGKKIVHHGGPGSGQHAKLCNQIVIAGTMIGVCESLLYGYKAGLDLPHLLDSIRGGAAACWTLENLAPRILQRNFDPGFFVEHFIKDMGIALEEAKRMGLTLPGLALVHHLYEKVQTLGHGRSGTHALMLALEDLSHTTVHTSTT